MSVQSMVVGAVTDSSARVVAKVTGSSATLDYSGGSSGSVGPVTPTSEGVARFELAGLAADASYSYSVNDGVSSPRGTFHTPGPAGQPYSFSFAYATCAGLKPTHPGPSSALLPDRVSDHPVFDEIRRKTPLFFIHNGDLHYYDLGSGDHGITDPGTDTYHRAYDDVLATRQGQLYREVPFVHGWDDHDYGPNNSESSAPNREDAATVYREREPSYELPAPGGTGDNGIYHSFQIGRMLFIVSDLRYYRDSSTMLGQGQLDWMDSVLSSSTAEALVWATSQRWISPSGQWGNYASERLQVRDMFADNGWLDRMCLLHGDNHLMGIDSGANNPYGGFPMYCFAPMDCNPGSHVLGYDIGTNRERGQYGTVQVTDNGNFIRITGTGWVTNDDE